MRTIFFPFNFRYPHAGVYEEGNAITVCEPSYDKRATHRRMAATVMDALSTAYRKSVGDQASTEQADAAPPSEGGGAKELEPEMLFTFVRMGMSTDEFVRWSEWVQRELTSCAPLAYVGADLSLPIKDRSPVTEEVWMNIAREGGVEAIDRVIAEFASFFLSSRKSATTTGAEPSSSSAPKATGSSRGRKA